jgi:hypothetical protein
MSQLSDAARNGPPGSALQELIGQEIGLIPVPVRQLVVAVADMIPEHFRLHLNKRHPELFAAGQRTIQAGSTFEVVSVYDGYVAYHRRLHRAGLGHHHEEKE